MAERPSSLTTEERELLARRTELERAVTIDLIDEAGARALALVERVRLLSEKDARKVGGKVASLIDQIRAIEAKYLPPAVVLDEMKNDTKLDPIPTADEDASNAETDVPADVPIYDEGATHSEEIIKDWLDSQHVDYQSVEESDYVEAQIARELAGLPAVEEEAPFEGVSETHLFDEALVADVDRDISAMMASSAAAGTVPTVFEEQVDTPEQNEARESGLSEKGRAWLEKIAGPDWAAVLDVDADADVATIACAIPIVVAIRKPNTPEGVISMFQGFLEGRSYAEIGAGQGKSRSAIEQSMTKHTQTIQAHYNLITEDAMTGDHSGIESADSGADDEERDESLADILIDAGYSEDYADALLKRASADRAEYLDYTATTSKALAMLRLEFIQQQGLASDEEVGKAMKAFFLPYAGASNLDAIASALGEGRTVEEASELILKGIKLLYANRAKEEAA